MSKHSPAHARPDGPDDTGGDGPGGGTPLTTALRELGPPRHGPDFWSDLDGRLADEPQLRLAPRSAIRPITQPPPVIDDRSLLEGLKGNPVPTPPRPSSRRTIIGAVAAVLVLLLVVAALQSPDDDPAPADDARTETTVGRAPTSEDAAPPPTTALPPTTVPGTIDPNEPLSPHGVGPLEVGATMADLQAAGLTIQPDQAEFQASGGSCYVARVAGALDLELRFRAPEGQYGVDEPSQGVLAAVSIESGLPTDRTSNTSIALGAPQDQVLAVYGGNLDDRSHPLVANGHIFRADNGDGTGIAFATDGVGVIGITSGEYDVIRFVNQCG